MSLADLHLWSGKNKPLLDPDSFHARFAEVLPSVVREEGFEHWFDPGIGRPSVPPGMGAGAFLLALREGRSDREAEQRMRFDIRWKWALGLGLSDHGCDHSSLCVFRARPLAHEEEGRLFHEIASASAGLATLGVASHHMSRTSSVLGRAQQTSTRPLGGGSSGAGE